MRAILLGLGLIGCTSSAPIQITGDVDATAMSPQPESQRLSVVFSPEQGGHVAIGTTVTGFPNTFSIYVDALPSHVFEDRDGFKVAGGELAYSDSELTNPDDGFDQSYELTGYVFLYLTEAPNVARPPFLVDDLDAGWNLIQAVPVSCDDVTTDANGLTNFNFHYAKRSLDSGLHVELGVDPWRIPFTPCP